MIGWPAQGNVGVVPVATATASAPPTIAGGQQGDENPPLRIVTLDRSASESAHPPNPFA